VHADDGAITLQQAPVCVATRNSSGSSVVGTEAVLLVPAVGGQAC
jgi:hypothetical protein